MARPEDFDRNVQTHALMRQKNKCASCGEKISALGLMGRETHRFGEGAHAHHVKHVKFGGKGTLDNCVILCQACHYSAHEGGNYRFGTVIGRPSDFPHYRG